MLRLDLSRQQELRDNADADGWTEDEDASPNGIFSILSLLGEAARYMDEEEAREAYDEALSAVIEGQHDPATGAVDAIVRSHGMPILDRITAEIGWHAGIDVVAALAIAIVLDNDAAIVDPDQEIVLMVGAWTPSDLPSPLNAAWLAPGVRWEAHGVTLSMAETLATACIGRPLRTLVSHPVLDRHALTVTGVCPATGGRILIEVDSDRTPLTADALIAMRGDEALREARRIG